MSSRLRSLLTNYLLIVASLLVALLLAEIALRVIGFSYMSFHRPDAQLGLRLRSNMVGRFNTEGGATVHTNSAGFRDLERSVAKPPGTVRIAVLGDSYIEALQVDQEAMFTAQLERKLNDCHAFGDKHVEVLNFGVSGYGTAQQLLTFRLFASRYAPDLVLAAVFTGNDVRNNSRDIETDKMRPFYVADGQILALDQSFATSDEFTRRTNRMREFLDALRVSRVVQVAYLAKDSLAAIGAGSGKQVGASEAGLDDDVFVEPKTPAWRDAWNVTELLLRQMDSDVRAAGSRLMLVTLTNGIQVNPDPEVRRRFAAARGITDIFYPDHRIAAVAARLSIESIMLAPSMQQMAERDKVYFHGFANTRLGTGHWNEAGHRAAAELVAQRLCARRPTP